MYLDYLSILFNWDALVQRRPNRLQYWDVCHPFNGAIQFNYIGIFVQLTLPRFWKILSDKGIGNFNS